MADKISAGPAQGRSDDIDVAMPDPQEKLLEWFRDKMVESIKDYEPIKSALVNLVHPPLSQSGIKYVAIEGAHLAFYLRDGSVMTQEFPVEFPSSEFHGGDPATWLTDVNTPEYAEVVPYGDHVVNDYVASKFVKTMSVEHVVGFRCLRCSETIEPGLMHGGSTTHHCGLSYRRLNTELYFWEER